ncbi:MAG: extracellular solute-binding protein [Treponema sp.]|nr:extracellular solute-binding protein [Treponema sp.]
MKKTMFGALFASALVLTGLLTSCGDTKKADDSKAKFDLTGAEGIEGWKAFDEKVTITVPVYDRGKSGYPAVDNNYWTQWVQKEFGDKYNIEVKYIAIPRTDVMTKYSMLIAAKDTPTILMEYDYPKVTQWANDGAMQVIDLEAFKHIAPTYYKKMVDNNQLDYTKVNGEDYFVLSERPFYNSGYSFWTFVRMDWLRKVGYDHAPANYTEYCDALDKIIAAGLTDQAPVGFSIPNSPYVQNFSFRNFPVNEEEWAMHSSLGTPSFTWEPTKKYLKRVNFEYNKGYISKEFELDLDGSQAQTDFINGKTFSFGGYMNTNVDWLNAFYKNNPDAELALASGTASVDGDLVKTVQGRADNPFGMIVGFSSFATADQLKAAWMYMEWMSQSDVLFKLQYGIEGINYTMGNDGYPVMINLEGTGKPEMMNHNNNVDMWCIVTASRTRKTGEDSIKAIAPQNLPQDFTQDMINAFQDTKKAAAEGRNYTDPIFAVSIEAESEYNAPLFSLYQEYFTKLVKCNPSEFEDLYAKLSKDYLAAGYQEIIDERLEAYKAGKTTKLPSNSRAK